MAYKWKGHANNCRHRKTYIRGQKKHMNFFNASFLHPPPKKNHFGPRKKSLCASFSGKERKKGTHINFWGAILAVKKGVPNGPFWTTKIELIVFFFSLPLCMYQNIGGGDSFSEMLHSVLLICP